ncbi:Organic solute transporter subunit alpha, partial [Ophiophagus hannah]
MVSFLTLVSVVIFMEDAVYLSKKTRCFLLRRLLLPDDADHGGRLRRAGSHAGGLKGHPHADPDGAMLLMYYRKPDDKPGCCLRESPERNTEIKQ